jgi:glycosyltransferase involved in cell wall biosynthesis
MTEQFDLIVPSHLRWNFVFQRPQHLMTRFAKERRVFFFEEPEFGSSEVRLEKEKTQSGVLRVVPHIPANTPAHEVNILLRKLLDDLIAGHAIKNFVLWYYTPMMLSFTDHLEPLAIAYDCMDELSLFKNAPSDLLKYEDLLFNRADVVFTGGHSLFEHKKSRHSNIHPVPSSIDFAHFAQARSFAADGIDRREDQKSIPHPRLGYFGVVDERMDLPLLSEVATLRPQWQLVILGPVVKIDPATLPRQNNIHYLGGKSYGELPSYIAGWDIAMLPFAIVDSTRFISPTKTPEYLAAGKPVLSTPVQDVVRPYGELGLVSIVKNAEEFVAAAEKELRLDNDSSERRQRADALLAQSSWDATWNRMNELLVSPIKSAKALGKDAGLSTMATRL